MVYRVAICRGYSNGRPSAYDGQYLSEYTPHEEVKGSWTTDRSKAKRYASFRDFLFDWYYAIGTRPWDGKPDCPLTAFNIEVLIVDEGDNDNEDGDDDKGD
jgi:hypothetical protein